ncbi:hypothetical protein D9M71_749120 [compost metagenome]
MAQATSQRREFMVMLAGEREFLAGNGDAFLERWWRPAKLGSCKPDRVIAGNGMRERAGAANLPFGFHKWLAERIELDWKRLPANGFAGQAVLELVDEAVAVGTALVRVLIPAHVAEQRGRLCQGSARTVDPVGTVAVRVGHCLHST